jgi:hypothetical protein
MRLGIGVLGVVFIALLLVSPSARASAPQYLPVQGVLTDADGVPITTSVSLQFTLYDAQTSGNQLWTEIQTVAPTEGLFVAYLGQVTTLDLATFRDHGIIWMGVKVGSDAEMPRVRLGSTAFAGYAEYCGNVPHSFSDLTGTLPSSALPSGVVAGVQQCTGTQKVTGVNAAGQLVCATDLLGTDTFAALTCAAGQVPLWSGSAWGCTDAGYNTVSQLTSVLDSHYRLATWVPAWDDVTGKPAGLVIGAQQCANGKVATGLDASGQIVCAADTLGALTCDHPGEVARWDGTKWSCADDSLESLACAAGQVAKWDGAKWDCANDNNTSYSAGNGLALAGTTFSTTAPTCGAGQVSSWNGTAWTCVTDANTTYAAGNGLALAGTTLSIAAPACGAGQVSSWNGTAWTCVIDANTTYAAGNGLALAGTTFSTNATTCGANQYSKWNGSAWTCATDNVTAAGNGINLAAGTISTNAQTCVAGQHSFWNGTAWTCTADTNTTYAAGSGIALTGTTISINAPTCGAGQYSYWNGSAWICRAERGSTGIEFTDPLASVDPTGNQVLATINVAWPDAGYLIVSWDIQWNCPAMTDIYATVHQVQSPNQTSNAWTDFVDVANYTRKSGSHVFTETGAGTSDIQLLGGNVNCTYARVVAFYALYVPIRY